MTPLPVLAVTLSPPELRRLRSDVWSNHFITGTLTCGQDRWPVEIRHRGNQSRTDPKPSYEVRFPGRPFRGARVLHLNANYWDPSLVRSRLSFDLFAAAGCPAPAAEHVELRLNQAEQGVYTATEAVDDRFCHLRGQTIAAIYYAVSSAANFGALDPRTGERKADLTAGYERAYPAAGTAAADLAGFIRHTLATDDDTFARNVDRALDVESYLRWFATAVFIGHYDGLCHNYALCRPAGGRWLVVPWDCDATWGRDHRGRWVGTIYPPLTDATNHLTRRLLQVTRWRGIFRTLMGRLLDEVFQPPALAERINRLYADIWTAATRDAHKGFSNIAFWWEQGLLRHYASVRHRVLTKNLQEGS